MFGWHPTSHDKNTFDDFGGTEWQRCTRISVRIYRSIDKASWWVCVAHFDQRCRSSVEMSLYVHWGPFSNPILRRNRVVWDSYFHWLDIVPKGLIVLCHLIFRFSVTCLTEFCVLGQCCLHGPTFPSDGFHDIVLLFQHHWSFGWKVSWWEKLYYFEEKYITGIRDTFIKVDLMLTEALQNLLTINLQQKVNRWDMEICIKVSIIMYSEGQRRVVVME